VKGEKTFYFQGFFYDFISTQESSRFRLRLSANPDRTKEARFPQVFRPENPTILDFKEAA